jgi:hypothetical protein
VEKADFEDIPRGQNANEDAMNQSGGPIYVPEEFIANYLQGG